MTDRALGQILLENEIVAQDHLIWALEQQRGQRKSDWKLLGEILVDAGQVSRRDLWAALDRQAELYEVEFFTPQTHVSVRSNFKRSLDLLGATVGLAILLVLLLPVALAIVIDSPGPIFFVQHRVGLRGRQFRFWKFRTLPPTNRRTKLVAQKHDLVTAQDSPTRVGKLLRRFHLDGLPQFLNVLKGEMSLVGTRPPTPEKVKTYSQDDWQYLLSVKPGITGLRQVHRQECSLTFEKAIDLELSYARQWRQKLDLKIIARTIKRVMFGFEPSQPVSLKSRVYSPKVSILNLEIDNLSSTQLLKRLDRGVVFTPNVDHLMKLQQDQDFYHVYHQADFKTCDSQILVYASQFLGQPIREKVSGSDFFPEFCRFHKDNDDIKIFLLGGADGVAKRAKTRINRIFGRQIIIEAHSPSFSFVDDPQECLEIIAKVNRCQPTVLAVGVGAPKQEKWICQYRDQMPSVQIFLAIGATIDFEAGNKRRAPQWVSDLGIEWLYRLCSEPQRLWKRYLIDDIPFVWLLLKQKLGFYTSPFELSEQRSIDHSPCIKSVCRK